MATKEKKIDFKSAMKELEEINLWFQNEEIDLDEGLIKLKRAKELIALCKGRLTEVENEFTTLKKEMASGEMLEEIIIEKGSVSDDELPF